MSDRDAASLRSSSEGPVRLVAHEETGFARMVGASPGHTLGRPAGVAADAAPEVAARAFIGAHQKAFGLAHAHRDLTHRATGSASKGAGSTVRFDQTYEGLPVLAGELVVRTNGANEILSVAGETLPPIEFDTIAEVSAERAQDVATAAIARAERVAEARLRTTTPELVVFDRGLFGGPGPDETTLAWRMDVADVDDPSLREFVLIDADDATVILHFSLAHGAKDRRVCDNAYTVRTSWPPVECGPDLTVVRGEGDPASAVTEVNRAYNFSGGFYDFLMTHFGRDSVDDAGLPLTSTVRWCEQSGCPRNNAFWFDDEAYYMEGLVIDDVVAHEVAHGLTEYTAKLFYYYQSGAINESLSDLYGELYDLHGQQLSPAQNPGDDDDANRWLVGEEGTADIPAPLRNMQDPTAISDDPDMKHPDRVGSPYYHEFAWDSGGVHINSGVNNKAVYLLTDGDTFNGNTITALGADKVLQLYYEAQTALLTSGSDYADLADALEQACSNLVGSHRITTSDCAQVGKAVTATEMRMEPPGPTAADAPYCPANGVPTFTYQEDVEGPVTSWTATNTVGTDWTVAPGYATSANLAFYMPNRGQTGVADLVSPAIPVPTTGFLRFAHAHEFEDGGWDGGVLAYSTDDGSTWTNAASLPNANAPGANGLDPNRTIQPTSNAPEKGQPAFINDSGGFTASRLDLSTLATQTVRFRWRVATDGLNIPPGDRLGWVVDDVEVYSCGPDNDPPTFDSGSDLDLVRSTPSSLQLAWPRASDNVVVSAYDVFVDGLFETSVTATDIEITGLSEASTYDISVTARDTSGNSSTPLNGTFTTADVTAPTFPGSAKLSVSGVGEDEATVSWPAASDNLAVDHYQVTVTQKSGAGVTTDVPASKTSFTAAALSPDTAYSFSVVAFDAADNKSSALTASTTTEPDIPNEVARLWGEGRYDTAAAVSEDAFPDGAATVFIATGFDFPDALAAGPVAGMTNAPILLVQPDAIPQATADELRRLDPDSIVILGGDVAVKPTVETQLRGFAPAVGRLKGDDRYETAVEVSKSGFGSGVDVAYIATGLDFPDALAGAAAAGRDQGPVLLVRKDQIPSVVAGELQRLSPGRIVILGGDAAVNPTVEAQLRNFTSGSVTRLKGDNRYDTAASVASTFDADAPVVYIATGLKAPDALAGTPAAVLTGAPIMLVPGDSIPDSVETQLLRIRPRRIVVLGGAAVVTDAVQNELNAYLGS